MFNHLDQAIELVSSTVCLIQNTLPPVRRTAAASRLTFGTISAAMGDVGDRHLLDHEGVLQIDDDERRLGGIEVLVHVQPAAPS